MLDKGNIFLIGPMGSGKDCRGADLARMLRLHLSRQRCGHRGRTGVDIAFIFEKEGESGFRAVKRNRSQRLTRLDSIVLATGAAP